MPRGSKPGERRGGRQRGTSNKKTALISAAFAATASRPDLLPLDFLLGVMRDPSISTRVAASSRSGGAHAEGQNVTIESRRAESICIAAGIVAIGLVDLHLQHRSHVPRLNTDHRQTCLTKGAE